MMIRSCGVLSVVLVGVLFSGVKDISLKLGKKKILVAIMATIGMAIFRIFDPNASSITSKSSLLGLGFMILSLIADGFLPDFQAVIKSEFKPEPTIMMAYVNKWATFVAFLFALISGDLLPMLQFLLSHN
jgi:UAA transporter family